MLIKNISNECSNKLIKNLMILFTLETKYKYMML